MARHTTLGSLFSDIANAIRSKTGGSTPLTADNFDTEINGIVTDPSGPCTATNDTILAGYNAYAGGVLRDGGIPIKSANDVQVSGQSVFTPKGYYNADVTKSVASGSTALTAYANGYVYANRAAGYQAAGNPSVHYATKAGTTITPSAAQQTAIPANTLATGAITVKAVDNVSAGNIKAGTSIAGVMGNLSAEPKFNFAGNGARVGSWANNFSDYLNMPKFGFSCSAANISRLPAQFQNIPRYAYKAAGYSKVSYFRNIRIPTNAWNNYDGTVSNIAYEGTQFTAPVQILLGVNYSGGGSSGSRYYFGSHRIYNNYGKAEPFNTNGLSATSVLVTDIGPNYVELAYAQEGDVSKLTVYEVTMFSLYRFTV